MGITPLDRNIQRGKPYEDNLFLFRCLALHNSCHTKNLERDTKHYYQQYREADLSKKKFHGVKLSELDKLEKVYDFNIQVYSLAPTHNHGEEDDQENAPNIAATLRHRRSHRDYAGTLYLNLYENHFSYIKDPARCSKSFAVLSVASTGRNHPDWIDTKRPVTEKSGSSILAAPTMSLKHGLSN